MLNRYIGNKKKILGSVTDAISGLASPGDLVCDAFSGTLAVSLELKRRGFRVASNDINLFSAMYGRAYLTNDGVPRLPAADLVPRQLLAAAQAAGDERLSSAKAVLLDESASAEDWARLRDIAVVTSFLDQVDATALPGEYARTDFFDHYCEEGPKSEFTSSRGAKGRRRFFSPANARRIDAILGHLRMWVAEQRIEESAQALLTCQLLEAVERVSNTQGTYHDFPRKIYDPRALDVLRLQLPSYDGLLRNRGPHILGSAQDSLDFIATVPSHRVLYLDPPYNFRQYTAYYFMLNLISGYPMIPDLDSYFSQIQFVRGQNMDDDFCSTFSRASTFVSSLKQLIASAEVDTVVLSYYNGPNHWREFKTGAADGNGADPLETFFSSDMFEKGTLTIKPVKRLNYQSYGGFTAEYIDELIVVAQKKRGVGSLGESEAGLVEGTRRDSIRPVA